MACSDEGHGRSRTPGADDREWSHRSGTRWPGDRVVGWRHVHSVPCTWRRGAWVSWLSLKTKVDGLSVVWPQNHWDGFSSLSSKPVATVSWLSLKTKVVEDFPVWASKPATQFDDLGLKITVTISWFGPQNHAGFGLSVAPQNRRRKVGMGHTSRSGGLLRLEASLTRVSQSDLKTGGGATAGGVRGTITKVVSEAS
jgi:hypothetical protein